MSGSKHGFTRWHLPGSGGSTQYSKPIVSSKLSREIPSLNDISSEGPLHSGVSVANATGHAILSTIKGSIKLLQKGSHVFPPLQSAVETFLEILDSIETTQQGSTELREMASNLPHWAIVLSTYLSDSQPERMSQLVEKLTEDLLDQARYIQRQQEQGRAKRLTESSQDLEDLRICYLRVETSFRQLQTDAGLSTWRIADEQLKDSRLNAMSPAHDARYDSSFSDKIERGGCLRNTRVSVLNAIRDWIHGGGNVKLYWTNGMAGTGKTTIAYSVCAELEQHGRLGASFFCSRASPECRDVSRILPTIAYQLAQQFYPFRSSLCRMLGKQPNIAQRNISVQFDYLIKMPLTEVKNMLPRNLIIVIDALDECSEPKTIQMMLNALFCYATDLPICFFLTSRPEPSVMDTFFARNEQHRSILHLHNVEEHLVKADIETYLSAMLTNLSLSESEIKQLASRAGVLFLYAATMAKYLLTRRGASTPARLARILSRSKNEGDKKDREIDQLYKTILDQVLADDQLEEEEAELIKHVLWTVVCAREPITKTTLSALLATDYERISDALQPLLSVIHVSDGNEMVSTLHASFPDFMLSSKRSGPVLCCDEATHHKYLTIRCFELMREQLQFNICGLETSYLFDKDVPDIDDRVNSTISTGLHYACRYWADHLRAISFCEDIFVYLNKFLHEQLLFWMEVLSLKGYSSEASKILGEAQTWARNESGASETRKFIHDARNFATAFAANPVCQSTPHIYISVLPLVPRQSEVRRVYWGRTKGLLQLGDVLMDRREGAALAVWEVGSKVEAIAFSPEGTCIASGHQDHMVRLWDAYSGASLGKPLQGHSNSVWCLAFSPEGGRIASGSQDCTIRTWDRYNGVPLCHPFVGHAAGVRSVAFSSDGSRIASGSDDWTTRIWDAHDGTLLVRPFEGHAGGVRSVVFSADGSTVVSGASDFTIEAQDAYNGTPLRMAIGKHAKPVLSVAFSLDGRRLLSASLDGMVRVWDLIDSTVVYNTFIGRTRELQSVAFSSDGTLVMAGLSDRTIQVREVYDDAAPTRSFPGHNNKITSVSFSPDGTRMASGSLDGTIRTWDPFHNSTAPTSSPSISSPVDYEDPRASVGFSSDGTQVFFAYKYSLQQQLVVPDYLWDAHTGAQIDETNTTLIPNPSAHKLWNYYHTNSQTASGERYREVTYVDPIQTDTSGSKARQLNIRFGFLDGKIEVAGREFRGHTRMVLSVGLSQSYRYMVSGSLDCTVRMWDLDSGAQLGSPFRGHTNSVTAVAFSPDTSRIVSKSKDGTTRLWQVAIPDEPCPSAWNWHINDQGWIVNSASKVPLCWQPAEIRDIIPRPPNILTIARIGPIKFDLSNLLLGESWSQCYRLSRLNTRV